MFKSKSLAEAYSLARLQDLVIVVIQQQPITVSNQSSSISFIFSSSQKPVTLTTSTVSQNETNLNQNQKASTSTILTSKEMDEKRAKRMCFWCDDKFSPGHRCKKKQLFVLQIKEVIDEEDLDAIANEIKESEEEMQAGQLALNALWGSGTNHTMLIRGIYKKVRLHVLVDTGSTHDFINEHIVRKLNLLVEKVTGIWVEVANG
uniref:Uncharacterized protein n=1 Tax=Manihot esculenta TaxID=3983 RepID=A0A2C9WKT3_MANES